jgi:hypothetical protein
LCHPLGQSAFLETVAGEQGATLDGNNLEKETQMQHHCPQMDDYRCVVSSLYAVYVKQI